MPSLSDDRDLAAGVSQLEQLAPTVL
jgi:hypothetical protein